MAQQGLHGQEATEAKVRHESLDRVGKYQQKKPCLQIELPDYVKSVLRTRADEDYWGKLGELRLAINFAPQGGRTSTLECRDER